MFVSAVQPVMTRRALFCTICSFCRFVSDIVGDHTVLAYSITGRMIVLYVVCRVSFCLPHEVAVSAFSILIDESAFSLVILVCSPKLRLVSSVRPRIFGCLTVGIMTLLIERLSVMLCSWVSGVKRDAVDFSGFNMKSFVFVYS